MKIQNFGRYQFEFIDTIQPALDKAGNIAEYRRHLLPDVRANRYASGPFCRFHLSDTQNVAGVYAVTVAENVRYIGECENLGARFGPNGYGSIAARNCHRDGQATNCKVNSLVLASLKAGDRIDVWFYRTARRKDVEAELLSLLKPQWNGAYPNIAREVVRITKIRALRMTHGDFQVTLQEEFDKATRVGQDSVRIRAGDLHRTVGGYPGHNHRMPQCCDVMKSAMRSGDKIVESPPSGKGSRLMIEYRLPRPM
jgi:hypothetical protein